MCPNVVEQKRPRKIRKKTQGSKGALPCSVLWFVRQLTFTIPSSGAKGATSKEVHSTGIASADEVTGVGLFFVYLASMFASGVLVKYPAVHVHEETASSAESVGGATEQEFVEASDLPLLQKRAPQLMATVEQDSGLLTTGLPVGVPAYTYTYPGRLATPAIFPALHFPKAQIPKTQIYGKC